MSIVDVVMPAHNAARYLTDAIESVINQTFTDWRIILIDDGSTDGTAKIAAAYQLRLGDKFEYIYQKNRGPSAARNNAIRYSNARLIALLDADDIWLPHRLEESVKVFENPLVGLAHGLVARIDSTGAEIDRPGVQPFSAGRIAPHIYMRRVNLPAPTVTFRRSCLDKVGLFDESMRATEDRDLWFRIALQYEVAHIPQIISYYRISSGSASANTDKMLEGQMRFIEKHYGAPGVGLIQRRKALSHTTLQRAETFRQRGKLVKAISNVVRGIFQYPFSIGNAKMAAYILKRCVRETALKEVAK
jgi:glycosyltransferase involved in cell wall biosynthesis